MTQAGKYSGLVALLAANLPLPQERPPSAPPPPGSGRSPDQTIRQAWAILLIAFGVFCALLTSTIYAAWHYRTSTTDTQSATLIIRSPAESVTWQRRNRAAHERASDGQRLTEGDSVRIAQLAGYGQAATIRLFDNSTLDMWAGADVRLEVLQTSRWNQQAQQVVLRQQGGYIRYDLRSDQPYETVSFRVGVGMASIELSPGGSYSIEMIPSDRQVLLTDMARHPPLLIDVAVRAGRATIQSQNRSLTILAGQRLEIDPAGIPSEPLPARWQLIRDGDFSTYSEQEYRNTRLTNQPAISRAATWQVGPASAHPPSEAEGVFRLADVCVPTQQEPCSAHERMRAAWLLRSGEQTKNSVIGMSQILGQVREGVDISEYRSLLFSLWARVAYQSVPLAGEQGTECPIMVRFVFKKHSSQDAEQERLICLHTTDNLALEPARAPGITYYQVPRAQWYHLRIELRTSTWLPDARYLRSVAIFANGHDYDAQVTGISLIGSHYPPFAQ